METEEEILEQKRIIEERKLGLEKYQAEISRIQVEIGYFTYRRNSGIGNCIEYDKEIRNLKKELKSQTTALKRDYGITNHLIPRQLREYDTEIFTIRRQLDKYVPDSPSEAWRGRCFPEADGGTFPFFPESTAKPSSGRLRERSREGGRDR